MGGTCVIGHLDIVYRFSRHIQHQEDVEKMCAWTQIALNMYTRLTTMVCAPVRLDLCQQPQQAVSGGL